MENNNLSKQYNAFLRRQQVGAIFSTLPTTQEILSPFGLPTTNTRSESTMDYKTSSPPFSQQIHPTRQINRGSHRSHDKESLDPGGKGLEATPRVLFQAESHSEEDRKDEDYPRLRGSQQIHGENYFPLRRPTVSKTDDSSQRFYVQQRSFRRVPPKQTSLIIATLLQICDPVAWQNPSLPVFGHTSGMVLISKNSPHQCNACFGICQIPRTPSEHSDGRYPRNQQNKTTESPARKKTKSDSEQVQLDEKPDEGLKWYSTDRMVWSHYIHQKGRDIFNTQEEDYEIHSRREANNTETLQWYIDDTQPGRYTGKINQLSHVSRQSKISHPQSPQLPDRFAESHQGLGQWDFTDRISSSRAGLFSDKSSLDTGHIREQPHRNSYSYRRINIRLGGIRTFMPQTSKKDDTPPGARILGTGGSITPHKSPRAQSTKNSLHLHDDKGAETISTKAEDTHQLANRQYHSFGIREQQRWQQTRSQQRSTSTPHLFSRTQYCIDRNMDPHERKHTSGWPFPDQESRRRAQSSSKDVPHSLPPFQDEANIGSFCYTPQSQNRQILFSVPGTPLFGQRIQQIVGKGKTLPISSPNSDNPHSQQVDTGQDKKSHSNSANQPKGELVARHARVARSKTATDQKTIAEYVQSKRETSIKTGTQYMELVRSVFISINLPKTFSLQMALEFPRTKWKNPAYGASSWSRFAEYYQQHEGVMEAPRDELLLDIKVLLAQYIPRLKQTHQRYEGVLKDVSQISTAVEACFEDRVLDFPSIRHQMLKLKKTMLTLEEAQKLNPPPNALDLDIIFRHIIEGNSHNLRDKTMTIHMLETGARRSDLAGCRRHETTMQIKKGKFGESVAHIIPLETKGAALAKRQIHNVQVVHAFPWNTAICPISLLATYITQTDKQVIEDKTFLTVDDKNTTIEVTTAALYASLSRNNKKVNKLTAISPDRIGNCITKVLQTAGIPVTSKELRKSVSSLLKTAANLSDKQVCDHIGWMQIETWQKSYRRDIPHYVLSRYSRKMHEDIPIGWRIKRTFIPDEHKQHMYADSYNPEAIVNIIDELTVQEEDNDEASGDEDRDEDEDEDS